MLKKIFDSAEFEKNFTEEPKFERPKQTNKFFVLMIVSGILLAAMIAVTIYVLLFWDNGKNDSAQNSAATQNISANGVAYKYMGKLTGLGTNDENEVNPRVVAVMIDNHPDAYPQYGLNDASIVYEAPVEGGTTRFMAIYSASTTVEKIGPVRSARPYFLDWAEEYGDALYVHCGGSPDGLNEIEERNIFDANEFSRGSYFWRADDRSAPHNLYTGSVLMQKLLSIYAPKRTQTTDWVGLIFGPAPATGEAVNNLSAAYLKSYVIGWNYNASTTMYERLFNGEKFLNNKNEPTVADNVIVQFASVSVLDEVGRRKIIAVGSGDARVFRGGQMIRATWKKDDEKSRTKFFNANGGDEIAFAPGRTWIMVVPLNTPLTVGN